MKNYILLVGNYGGTNLGDEMLKQASLQMLASEKTEVKTMQPCGGDFEVFASGFRSMLNFRGQNWQAFLAIKNSSRVVFGGGGLINSDNWRSLVIWGQILAVALILGKQVDLVAQSFSSPPSTGLRWLLSKCNSVSVRDKLSQEYLSQVGLNSKLVSDLALDLDMDSIKNIFEDNKLLEGQLLLSNDYGICNAREYSKLSDSRCKSIVSMLEQIEVPLVFVPFDKSDIDFYNKYMSNSQIPMAAASMQLFQNAKFAIGMRLHFCLTAMKFGLDVLPLAYASKVLGLFGDLGLQVVDLYTLHVQKTHCESGLIRKNNEPK